MSDARKNIKVPEPLFDRLKDDKGPHRSWPQYFRDQLDEDADADDMDFAERLDRIESAAREATSAAQSTQRAIEDMELQR